MQAIIDLTLTLTNPFDYNEYKSKCVENCMSMGEYAQKVGMLKVGMAMFPELEPSQAYLKFIEVMNEDYAKINPQPVQTPAGQPAEQGCVPF